MNSMIVALVLTAFLYSSTQAALCSDTVTNICQLDSVYFKPANGYQCNQVGSTAYCTCPNNGVEIDKPCRLCNRTNPLQNVCRPQALGNTRLIMCLESNEYGAAHACLCSAGSGGDYLTTAADCDPTVTLTTRATTTVTTVAGGLVCNNGGVFYGGICHCPSGYTGPYCAELTPPGLCEKIVCKNNGTCAIRNVAGPYEGVCLCRYGFSGEYCELVGTLGFCSTSSCMNGGACKETVIGATRHAYCYCPAGYNGPKCATPYFICPDVGRFADPVMFQQGKYFDCTRPSGVLRIEQKSCPKGLRFNAVANLCTYSAY